MAPSFTETESEKHNLTEPSVVHCAIHHILSIFYEITRELMLKPVNSRSQCQQNVNKNSKLSCLIHITPNAR